MIKRNGVFMKKVLIIIIFIFNFQSWTIADDITDFEIEGMSLGESLLDYMSEDLIKKAINNEFANHYDKDFVSMSTWDIKENFLIYNDVGVILDLNDKNYKIYGLEGSLYLDEDNIDLCHKKQNEISIDIKNSLNVNYQEDIYFINKDRLPKHLSSIKYIDLEFDRGGVIRISCYEVIKGVQKNSNYHLLYVVVNSPKFWNYLGEKN
jgi:hypothetical protein